ncbi:hypothetical protein JHK84_031083 [Glycine max]|nr:hypothetical protein JHK87_030772 [Glycine soja]KAG4994127.1 hypothetical protein JHK86_030954 [Glycine max]KAG5145540.1 hypothetical protein JHK84_031083 [Glycine max]
MQASENAVTDEIDSFSMGSIVVKEDNLEYPDCGKATDACSSELDPESYFDALVTINTCTIEESEIEGENCCQKDAGVVDVDPSLATTTAMENEHSEPLEGSEPTVTILAKTNSDTKDSQQPNCWQGCMKPQKEARLRMMKILISLTPNVGLPNKVDNMKPLPNKLESKCNCIIM